MRGHDAAERPKRRLGARPFCCRTRLDLTVHGRLCGHGVVGMRLTDAEGLAPRGAAIHESDEEKARILYWHL